MIVRILPLVALVALGVAVWFWKPQSQPPEDAAKAFQALNLEEPPDWPGAAVDAAERALELDPELPEAYRALGAVAFYQDRFQRAYDLTLKALELDPSYVEAVYNAASFAQALGRVDEAVLLLLRSASLRPAHRAILAINLQDLGFEPQARELARQVLEEEPLSIYLNIHLARHELLAGELAAVRNRLERLARAYPQWEGIWTVKGLVEVPAGRTESALESFEGALKRAGGDYPEAEIRRARIHWQRGDRDEARRMLEGLAAKARDAVEGGDSWLPRWQLAAIEAIRGNPDEALGWFEKAVDQGHYHHHFDRDDPVFESLRGEPRFERQLKRMRERVAAMRERLIRELGPDLSGLPAV